MSDKMNPCGCEAGKRQIRIFTVTLNPAFDLHLDVEHFVPYSENYAKNTTKEAGGKGVNLSRALSTFGVANTAYIIAGKDNAGSFVSALESQGLKLRVFYTPGKIRENITVHTQNMPETRISLDDFFVVPETLEALESEMKSVCGERDIVIFNGRLPRGVNTPRAISLLKGLKALGVYLAVDCNSFSAQEIEDLHPWLIKPNEREAAMLLGAALKPEETVERLAGMADNVILSLGKSGGLFVSGGNTEFRAKAPDIKPVSTVGAGDSMLAGFIKAFYEGKNMNRCIAEAVAFGSASVLRTGSLPPQPDDVERLLKEITVTYIKKLKEHNNEG